MRIRTKWIVVGVVLVLLVGGGVAGWAVDKMRPQNSLAYSWKVNYGLVVPNPSKTFNVFDTRGGFHGDGEAFSISEFSAQEVQTAEKSTHWTVVDEKTAPVLKAKIAKFQKDVYMINHDTYQKAFAQNPIEVKKGSLFYAVTKDDGSYVIAILYPERGKLYTLEWVI